MHQALSLQSSPTSLTGSSILFENRNLLDIPVEVPERAPPPKRRGHQSMDSGRMRQGVTPPKREMGLPEMIARGIIDRGETLGINKTLSNTISEIRVSRLSLFSSKYLSSVIRETFQKSLKG